MFSLFLFQIIPSIFEGDFSGRDIFAVFLNGGFKLLEVFKIPFLPLNFCFYLWHETAQHFVKRYWKFFWAWNLDTKVIERV